MAKENGHPTVSVIIPTYNRAHLVGRAIRSVLEQTYQDFEIIVVDDGSTDNTEEVVRRFQEQDKRIKYIRHDTNRGAAAARNTGIKQARGKYIAFQDSDDEWLPEKLEVQMRIFEKLPDEVSVVYTDMWRIMGNKKEYFHSSPIAIKDEMSYIHAGDYGIRVGIGTAVIKKECFEKSGLFDENLPRYIDAELFMRLSRHYRFYHIPKPLVKYYDTEDSISANLKSAITAHKLILEKYFDDIKKERKILANHYLIIGVLLCADGEIEEGERYILDAFKTNPDLRKNRKLLSEHYHTIGNTLCSRGDFKNGRTYLIKAVKENPLNVKALMRVLLALFGQRVYDNFLKMYRKIKSKLSTIF